MEILSDAEFELLPGIYDSEKNFPHHENSSWSKEVSQIDFALTPIISILLETEKFDERAKMISKAKLLKKENKFYPVFRLPEKFAKTYGHVFWIAPTGVSKPEYACSWALSLPHYITPEFC